MNNKPLTLTLFCPSGSSIQIDLSACPAQAAAPAGRRPEARLEISRYANNASQTPRATSGYWRRTGHPNRSPSYFGLLSLPAIRSSSISRRKKRRKRASCPGLNALEK